VVKINVMLDLLFQIPTPHMNEGFISNKKWRKKEEESSVEKN